MKTLALILLAASVAPAQIGTPYPYPRGGSPVPGIPMPRRRSTTPKEKDPAKVLPSFEGSLKRMDNKTIVLEMDDYRVLEFRRNDKTKFFKGDEEAKPAIFKPGDRISIEGEQDPEANLTAVRVHWEKAGDGKPVSRRDDGPTEEQIAAAEKAQAAALKQERATEVAPPPAPRDPDDPGPPKLQRGKPAPRKVTPAQADEPERIASVTAAAPAPAGPPAPPPAPVSTPGVPEVPLPGAPSAATAPSNMVVERADGALPETRGDAFIRKAQEAALDFTETLPNYVCQEMIARFYSETSPVSWQAIDVVSTEVVYENGKEDYRKVTVNGKPTKKSIEETGGSWSTGEFGTVLVDIFSPATAADFRFRHNSRIAGVDARMYDYSVERENSHWTVRSGAQSYNPAYRGSVWVDPKTSRVLRIEMQASHFPAEFPLDKVESATDYQYVRLGGVQQFLLPVHAETLSCQRGTSRCSRNVIDFRNYHKYAGESTIEFGETKK